MNPNRVLVTGATGFLGRYLTAGLLSAGEHLTLAVREVATCPVEWRDDERIRIVETGRLEAAGNLDEAFADVSRVVHAAGLAHVTSPADVDGRGAFLSANADATRQLVELAVAAGVDAFVHISSIAAVTDNASQNVIDDDTSNAPATPYGQSKRIAEEHVATLAEQGRFAISLRPPLVFGAGAKGNWGALRRLAATGLPLPFASVRNQRSLIDAEDLTRAVLLLCSRDWPPALSGNYCIASEEAVSLAEIVTELRAGMGMRPRLAPCPTLLLHGLARATNRERAAAGLLGDLVLDAGRFRRTFAFRQAQNLKAAIRASSEQQARTPEPPLPAT